MPAKDLNEERTKVSDHKVEPVKPSAQELVDSTEHKIPLANILQQVAADPGRLSPPHILALQRAAGNGAVARLLNRAPSPAAVQFKLTVGAAHDPFEQEADQVAEQVLRMAEPSADASPDIRQNVQAESKTAQAASAGVDPSASFEAEPGVENQVQAMQGGGAPLPGEVRAFMEPRFGADFGDVRIHAGPEAGALNRQVSARAFTIGQDIYLGDSVSDLNSSAGKHLLAHELTHVIQQGRVSRSAALKRKAGDRPANQLIQRDWAIDPTVENPAEVVLTPTKIRAAISLNAVLFTDEDEIGEIRAVLGIPAEPSVVDEDFVNAVVRYQGSFGLKPDGMLGPLTSARLSQEITAEADTLGDPATGTIRRKVARRLHLRSMVSRTRGTVVHQGFVGPDENPEGAVTVRTGDVQGAAGNAISLEYTGENTDNVDWLQFINMQMFATPPAAVAPVFNAGTVATTGGPVNWSNAGTTNWFVDAIPGGSPLYNVSGGLNTRAAARRLAMFDQPGGPSGLPIAQAFTGVGALAAGAPTVTMRMRFDSYVIRANRARYHVSWTATTVYNIAAGTSSAISYFQSDAGTVAGLRGVHRTALLAEYAGNPIH